MDFKRWVRALGVLAILFHFVVILLVPNRDSYINQSFMPVVGPYVNLISMNTAWQFFSPDPGLATYLYARIQRGSELMAEDNMPPEDDEFLFRTSFNRRVATMRFVGKDPERTRTILIPWLCQKYPEATSVHIDKVVVPVPSLDAVKLGGKLNDLTARVGDEFTSGDCDRGELVE